MTTLVVSRVAHLATVSADGKPHLVPVVYAYDGKHIYIVLDEKPKHIPPMRLKRVRNIQANPNVSLLVDHYVEDWGKLAWVRVDGTARILHRGKAHDAAIKRLRAKYRQYRNMKIDTRPVIEVTIKRLVEWKAYTDPSGL
ncbi:MAG: TIGR03668 family PPOX class F420-dependent oxidoreductase [Acidobacteriota bacterium]